MADRAAALAREIRSAKCGFTHGTLKITVEKLESWASRVEALSDPSRAPSDATDAGDGPTPAPPTKNPL